MRSRLWSGLCLAVVLSLGFHPATAAEPAKLKGLLITGGCCHDYQTQKQIIAKGLAQRMNIAFDIVHEGGTSKDHRVSVYEKPDWWKGYDVIVHNECFGDVQDEKFLAGILAAHTSGVPAVFIHCSMHSYRKSPAADQWREMIGVTSQRHEKQRAEDVKVVAVDHPVMRGFPAEWKTPNGELYVIEKVWPNCTPLAQAFGPDTKQQHPVAWVNTFGKTRIFGTTLGHHNETMNSEEWLGLVSRGTLWAVDKLTDDGRPAAGFAGTGIGPITIDPPQPTPDPKFSK